MKLPVKKLQLEKKLLMLPGELRTLLIKVYKKMEHMKLIQIQMVKI